MTAVSAGEIEGETFENFDDGRISPVPSPVHLRSRTPSKDPITDASRKQQSSQKSFTKNSVSAAKKKTPASRELKGSLGNMPSLQKSPLPDRRHSIINSSQQTSSSRSRMITPKPKESGKKVVSVTKSKRMPTESQQHSS